MKKQLISLAAVLAATSFTFNAQAQWLVGGNALGSTGNFGSTTNQDVNFISNNLTRMTLTKAGLLGIGTTAPGFLLDVQTPGNASANFKSGTGTANLIIDRGNSTATSSVSYRTAGTPTWQTGTLGTDNFSIRNIALGSPAIVVTAANNFVGIGTNAPATKLDISGSNNYDLFSGAGDFRLGNSTYNIEMGVANAGGGAGDGYLAASHRLYLGTSNSFANTQTMSLNSNGRVGIGTFNPTARLEILGDTSTATPVNTVDVRTTYLGNVDLIGVYSKSVTAPGYGYGLQGEGGYIGVYALGEASTYAGPAYGLYAQANGSAGTRYGTYSSASNSGGTGIAVYGYATGNTAENSWGGYFDTKTYMNELRVGGFEGAAGYVASINGKLIAEEVRVALIAAWPDYVFEPGYQMLSIEALEANLKTNKCLPGMPKACDVETNGVDLGKVQTQIVEKLEESHLYIIQLQKQINELKAELNTLKADKK
ncbi:MAG: hypothetical protein JNK61_08050 [Bacteroidia bacterium]|nr:hypothetical protein [Bacteroidia bacterium]